MDDAYSTQLTAGETVETSGLEQLNALKEGDAFLVADGWGDMKGGADGLFTDDTRYLSRFVMTAGLARLSKLSSGVSQDNVFFSCHSTNRPLPPMGGRSAPAGVLHLERRRFLWRNRMFERVQMVNHGVEDILLPLAFDFGADFADIFQVRGTPRARRGTLHAPSTDGRRVQFRYTGLDDVDRRSCLAFSQPPARLTGHPCICQPVHFLRRHSEEAILHAQRGKNPHPARRFQVAIAHFCKGGHVFQDRQAFRTGNPQHPHRTGGNVFGNHAHRIHTSGNMVTQQVVDQRGRAPVAHHLGAHLGRASPTIRPKKCGRLPVAGTPKLAMSGLALSQAMRCGSSLTGTALPTATPNS